MSDPVKYSRNSYSDRAWSIVSKDIANEHLVQKVISQVEKIPHNKNGEYELEITVCYEGGSQKSWRLPVNLTEFQREADNYLDFGRLLFECSFAEKGNRAYCFELVDIEKFQPAPQKK